MFCKTCGKEISENAIFCEHCGQQVATELSEEEKAELEKAKGILGTKILTNAILGLGLCELGVPGLVFSRIASAMIEKYEKRFGKAHGEVSVAKGLSAAGKAIGTVYAILGTIVGSYVALLVFMLICIALGDGSLM